MALKILVNSTFGGGAEIQAALLARALKPDSFLVLDGRVNGETECLSHFLPGLPGAFKTLLLPHYAARLAARTGPGDTVLSFMPRSNFVNVLAAGRSGHRAVICEITQPSREFSGLRGALIKPLIKKLYPAAALTLANSKGNARDLEENFGFPRGKIRVVYNACDTQAVAEKAAEPLDSGYAAVFRRPVIITSGRLTAAKAHWRLLRIFSIIRKINSDAALVFLGDGELRKNLLGLCAKLGLTAYDSLTSGAMSGRENVFFAGFQPNPYKYLSRARLFAFTSLWEGLPNAVIEALACGLPVISSDCRSGPRELLAPDTDFTSAAAVPQPTATGILMPPFKLFPPEFGIHPDAAEELWAKETLGLLSDAPRLAGCAGAARERAQDFSLKIKISEWQKTLA